MDNPSELTSFLFAGLVENADRHASKANSREIITRPRSSVLVKEDARSRVDDSSVPLGSGLVEVLLVPIRIE